MKTISSLFFSGLVGQSGESNQIAERDNWKDLGGYTENGQDSCVTWEIALV